MANAKLLSIPRAKGTRSAVAAVMTAAFLAAGLSAAAPLASPALAADVDGAVTADTYSTSTRLSHTNGSNSKVAVGGTDGANRVAYMRFNAETKVGKSTELELKLRVNGGTAGKLRILQGPSSWAESSLNASNAPAAGNVIKTVNVKGGTETLTIALTGLESASNGLNIVLERTDGGVTRIDSREAQSSNAPSLSTKNSTPPQVGGLEPAPVPEDVIETTPDVDSDANCTVSEILVPNCGIWFGAAANPLKGESWDQALLNFEQTAERPMDIAHYYKRGQSAMFPNNNELNRQNEQDANRILFYNWKPSGLTWKEVADGKADTYLKSLAQHMSSNASQKFFLSLNAEMEDEVNQAAGSGQTAKDYANFYRHVVKVLRDNGASNMVTVMNYTGIQKWGEMSWFEELYPGNDVVDWIAQDPYAFGKPPVWLTDMEGMVNRTHNEKTWPGFYNWAAEKYPSKPQMLAEWGVDEDAAYPSYKADFWETASEQLQDLPKLKALVYWDSMGVTPNGDKLSVGITQVDSKASSLNAFQDFLDEDYINVARESFLNK